MNIVTVEQMIEIERFADQNGLSYQVMMHNAGLGISDWIRDNLCLRKGVVGLIGSGNNGGDTLIALDDLTRHGFHCLAFLVKRRNHDPLIKQFESHGGQVIDLTKGQGLDVLKSALLPGAVILDGILGTGLKLPLRRDLDALMHRTSEVIRNAAGVCVVAVDCPSGIDCDTGEYSPQTLSANHTLTMAAVKQGLLKFPARSIVGEIHLIDIGIRALPPEIQGCLPKMIGREDVLQRLPERPQEAHKGTFGTVFVLAGSPAFTGAAFLAGSAAYRVGCGLVHMGVMQPVYQNLAGVMKEAIWTILPQSQQTFHLDDLSLCEKGLHQADALVIGPGWGINEENLVFLRGLLECMPEGLPALFDADGLKLLAKMKNWWDKIPETSILTPHPGEMRLMSGLSVEEIQSNRWQTAKAFAKQWGSILVLKGACTVIAGPSGDLFVNPHTTTALSTAGTGDVLSGMIAGYLAQGCSGIQASVLGVWQHALAARKAAHPQQLAEARVIAGDLLEKIGQPD